MCGKQAAKQITDLDGSERRQHLDCNSNRTSTTPNANGKNACNRQHQQREGDWAKTQSKNQSDDSGKHPNGQHDVPPSLLEARSKAGYRLSSFLWPQSA